VLHFQDEGTGDEKDADRHRMRNQPHFYPVGAAGLQLLERGTSAQTEANSIELREICSLNFAPFTYRFCYKCVCIIFKWQMQ